MFVFYEGNDTIIEVRNLKDALTGDAIDDAVLRLTLLTREGNPVVGDSWPKSFSLGADGVYRVTVLGSLELKAGDMVQVIIEMTFPGTARWLGKAIVKARES